MKTSILKNRKLQFALVMGCAALTGCLSDSGNSSNNSDNVASIRGTVQGDVETNASGTSSGQDWEGTIVTTHTINADGSLSATVDSATATANGSFVIQTTARGEREYILRARRGSSEWMAHFEGTLESDQTEDVRPMNLESTLESAVLLQLESSIEGREVHASDVNLAIDADVAVSSSARYRGSEAARTALVSKIAASVQAASRARAAFLIQADAQYASYKNQVDSACVQAEAHFNTSLYVAGNDTASARSAERAYLNAVVNAYLRADIERVRYARSSEASYYAFVHTSGTLVLSDSARAAISRNYARILAIASDTAMRAEFRAAGSSPSRLQMVIDAGARFRSSVDTSKTHAQLDSAVVRFRADVRTAFNNSVDTTFTVFSTVATQLSASMDSLSNSLQTSLQASASADAMGQAYATAQVQAQAQLQSQLQVAGQQPDKAKAAAQVFAFLSVRAAGMN